MKTLGFKLCYVKKKIKKGKNLDTLPIGASLDQCHQLRTQASKSLPSKAYPPSKKWKGKLGRPKSTSYVVHSGRPPSLARPEPPAMVSSQSATPLWCICRQPVQAVKGGGASTMALKIATERTTHAWSRSMGQTCLPPEAIQLQSSSLTYHVGCHCRSV